MDQYEGQLVWKGWRVLTFLACFLYLKNIIQLWVLFLLQAASTISLKLCIFRIGFSSLETPIPNSVHLLCLSSFPRLCLFLSSCFFNKANALMISNSLASGPWALGHVICCSSWMLIDGKLRSPWDGSYWWVVSEELHQKALPTIRVTLKM